MVVGFYCKSFRNNQEYMVLFIPLQIFSIPESRKKNAITLILTYSIFSIPFTTTYHFLYFILNTVCFFLTPSHNKLECEFHERGNFLC